MQTRRISGACVMLVLFARMMTGCDEYDDTDAFDETDTEANEIQSTGVEDQHSPEHHPLEQHNPSDIETPDDPTVPIKRPCKPIGSKYSAIFKDNSGTSTPAPNCPPAPK